MDNKWAVGTGEGNTHHVFYRNDKLGGISLGMFAVYSPSDLSDSLEKPDPVCAQVLVDKFNQMEVVIVATTEIINETYEHH